MGTSSEEDGELPLSLSTKKRCHTKRSLLSSDSEEGERKERSPSKRIKSAHKETCEEGMRSSELNATPSSSQTPRSSERLRKKSSLTFSLPSRKEVLKSMSPKGKRLRSQEKIKVLKPRKLVNNFLRERSSYVSRGEGGYDSDDSGMSDFINDDDDDGEDEEESTAESDQSSDSGKKDSGICRVKESKIERKKKRILDSSEEEKKTKIEEKRKILLDSSEEEKDHNDEAVNNPNFVESNRGIVNKRKTKNKRRKLNKFSDSDEDNSSGNKRNESKESNDSSEDSETDDICSSESPHKAEILRPRSQRVKRLIQKQEVKNHKMFGGLLKKRQKAKLDPKERLAKRLLTEDDDDGDLLSSDDLSSCDSCAPTSSAHNDQDPLKVAAACFAQLSNEIDEDEDGDDRDFIVKDVETSDEGMNSDGASQFLKLLDTFAGKQHDKDDNGTQNQDTTGICVGGNPFSSRRKRRKKKTVKKEPTWKRIKIEDDSDNSANDDTTDTMSSRYQPLHIAILEHDVPLVNKLIKEDSDCIYEIAFRKRTALHLAALEGQVELVKLLLKHGADQTALDYYHLPALAYALDGHPECVQLLLGHANIKNISKSIRTNKQEMNLLHFAVGEGRDGCNCYDRAKCLELLFHEDKKTCTRLLSLSDVRKFVPLVAAVYAGQHECVQVLLRMGADMISFKTDDGGNILHFAVECASHFKSKWEPTKDTSFCLRELLKGSRLLIDQPDDNGFTPLMYACESGNAECVRILLDNGALCSFVDSHGTSSLHLAAMSGNTECVQLLLNSGHQVDCVDKYGWPPLLYANFKAHESCVLALMKPKPEQVFVLGELLRRARRELEKKRTVKVVKNVLVSLANHDAYYTVFNEFIRQNPEVLDENNYGLLQHIWRAILDFDNKRRWFVKKLSQIRSTSGKRERLPLEIDRANVLGSAMNQMGRILGHALRHRDLIVTFQNEPGICTGPKREFFACFCKDVVDPKRHLFMITDDAQFSPVPNAYFAKYFTEEAQQDTSQTPSSQQGPSTGKEECSSECTDEELMSAASQAEARYVMAGNVGQPFKQLSAEVERGISLRSEGQTALENFTANQGTEDRINISESVAASNESGCNERVVKRADIRHSSEEQNNEKRATRNLSLRSRLKQLRFIGRMVGFSIFENLLLDLHLSKPFVKQILGIPLSHPDDLSSFDYELHKNAVTWLQENCVNELDLSFNVDALNPWNSKPVTIELNDDCDKKLTDDNKEEYSKSVSQFKLEKSIKDEVGEFTGGLHEVIPREFLSLFTADEFSLLINGVAKLDVGDWKKHTEYKQCTAEDDVIKWFWNIVTPLKEEEKALLMKFSTGSPCVPLGGFAALTGLSGPTKFTISKIAGLNKIPMASTCFNMLKLTSYSSEKHLKDKLLIAIRHGAEGFSFS